MRGTSGARKGYKIFSISTTIRNPKRNVDFLMVFKKYDGKLMDDLQLFNYYFELVKLGLYQFKNIPLSVKNKLDNEEELTEAEVRDAIKANPQATGLSGRVMTLLRALQYQGFLKFQKGSQRKSIIKITKLGNDLIENVIEGTITYTKSMIGMHANSPVRKSLHNKSVPFLNTIFVINEVNRLWKELGNDPKGILRHEFGVFVLSMKDCDYLSVANEIIKYRKKFRYEFNELYVNEYLKREEVLSMASHTITSDYPDEVFRKFEMTGLLVSRGAFNYKYIDFSTYNMEKIRIILKKYSDYKFIEFKNQDEYYNYIENINIPWEKDELIRRKVIESKTSALGMKYDIKKSISLVEQETLLDQVFYRKALDLAISETNIDKLVTELKILSGKIRKKSSYDYLAEPLRLEYLLALLIGKVYGTEKLVSNIIYGEDGLPLHYAPAGKSDIILYHEDGSYIFEPTMQRSRSQLLNNETTNIVRHILTEKRTTGLDYRVMMIAPAIHRDVADYFLYNIKSNNVKILPSTIDKTAFLLKNNKSIKTLNESFDLLIDKMISSDLEEFVDYMNYFEA